MSSTSVENTSKRRAAVFVCFCLFLLIQGFASFAIRPEPYPAIRMPSFGNAPDAEGLFNTSQAVVDIAYSDGSALEPDPSELMRGFRFSSAKSSMAFMFSPDGAGDATPEVIEWLKAQAVRLGDGRQPISVSFCFRDGFVDIRDASYVDMQPCNSTTVTF